ncbi:hypothetical protein TRFO_41614 [Tritrichomonas foetus]|uniref:Uncharacterized protein n=1 Tax=Tritrichomonas foetus TaxID=1144522 RepID=A0A1J4L007_9EUKA|nr:hypothetical protein TRFO_41614 [Tritrichomonas foetus]|eukprot:OHT16746.1 hypothetical protein TRFO_41614 [Tritrichomonas foetus]
MSIRTRFLPTRSNENNPNKSESSSSLQRNDFWNFKPTKPAIPPTFRRSEERTRRSRDISVFKKRNVTPELASERYPMFWSIFHEYYEDKQDSHHRVDFEQPAHNNSIEQNDQFSDDDSDNEIEPIGEAGGFSFTPMNEVSRFDFESGFNYFTNNIDQQTFENHFNEIRFGFLNGFYKLRDQNAMVRIPDPSEGFRYNVRKSFGDVSTVTKTFMSIAHPRGGRGGRNDTAGGRGGRGGNRGRGGQNNRGGNRGRGGQNNRGGGNNPRNRF